MDDQLVCITFTKKVKHNKARLTDNSDNRNILLNDRLMRPVLSPERVRRFVQLLTYNLQNTQDRVEPTPEDLYARPLSDDLEYYRILRTSTLVAVPEVCCVDC